MSDEPNNSDEKVGCLFMAMMLFFVILTYWIGEGLNDTSGRIDVLENEIKSLKTKN
jgi:hypothetical protein